MSLRVSVGVSERVRLSLGKYEDDGESEGDGEFECEYKRHAFVDTCS